MIDFLKNRAGLAAAIVFGLLAAFTSPSAAADFEGGDSKLAIHGFLSQAYGNSSGGQIIGIPTDGTSDYRNAALQFRYTYTSKDAFVLQLSHTRFGTSALQNELPDVQLNWVFYQKQLPGSSSLKIGKFPVPIGIYNETLHVGTVLPFYRAPFMIYGDGAFTSETINGVGFYHTLNIGDWDLETDLYVGEWTYVQQILGVITSTRSKDIVGTQIWLQTPIEGVRFGIAGNRKTEALALPPFGPGGQETAKSLHASIDVNLEQFLFQTEYRKDNKPSSDYYSYYGLAGIKLFDNRLGVNVLAEFAYLTIPGFVSDLKLSKDYAVGLRYSFRPDLVAKAEYHQMKTFIAEDPIVSYFGDPLDVKYYIVSLAVSF